MADLPFVDTHVHFWDLQRPDLRYSWLQRGVLHPILGNIEEIKLPLFDAARFQAETAQANVTKIVHVQAALGIEDPVNETRWLQEQADAIGLPHAIVAHADLKDPDLERELERHAEASSLLRGIRDFSEGDFLVDPAFERGFARLAKHGLVCDLDCQWQDMPKARDLAARHPDTPVVLDHAGFPLERTPEYLAHWRRGISALAEADNAICKISGLGMCDNNWTVDSIRPWFEHCVEAFGIQRCVLGTNWPVDRMYSNYGTVLDAYAQIAAQYTPDEQVALFSANAERLFAI
jgi:predicted TIM-barrel fold metal-dependent hydrolase